MIVVKKRQILMGTIIIQILGVIYLLFVTKMTNLLIGEKYGKLIKEKFFIVANPLFHQCAMYKCLVHQKFFNVIKCRNVHKNLYRYVKLSLFSFLLIKYKKTEKKILFFFIILNHPFYEYAICNCLFNNKIVLNVVK